MTWLNPTPAFPAYSGPYKVGSVNVEIPASELESPGPSLSPDRNLPTVAFRIFYPCQPHSKEKYVRWIPSPQREYIGAYARFLGASNVLSQFFALVPQLLYYVSIPAHHNAEILEPPESSKKWPVMIFSHGLGGSRNAYSHIVGSLASHGIVVIAPDHRDGSSPISFVHTPDGVEKAKPVEYKKVPHQASTEVYEARDEQLRVRLWELGLIHDALLKIDKRIAISNVADDHKKHKGLTMFAHRLAVQEPGSISFAGHSFGAATMVQFIKSTFYRSGSEDPNYRPLFTPSDSSSIVQQITPASSVILLDMWTLPIQSPATTWLRRQPMPCYNSREGGSSLLAILSEAFYKWPTNLNETKQIVAKPASPDNTNKDQPGPHIFYPIASAHLSQSDFGILFPWLTTQVLGAKDPERLLKLNTRAILQLLRNSKIEVAETSAEDLELTESAEAKSQDEKILSKTEDSVHGWVNLGTDPEDRVSSKITKSSIKAVVQGEVLGEVMKDQGR